MVLSSLREAAKSPAARGDSRDALPVAARCLVWTLSTSTRRGCHTVCAGHLLATLEGWAQRLGRSFRPMRLGRAFLASVSGKALGAQPLFSDQNDGHAFACDLTTNLDADQHDWEVGGDALSNQKRLCRSPIKDGQGPLAKRKVNGGLRRNWPMKTGAGLGPTPAWQCEQPGLRTGPRPLPAVGPSAARRGLRGAGRGSGRASDPRPSARSFPPDGPADRASAPSDRRG